MIIYVKGFAVLVGLLILTAVFITDIWTWLLGVGFIAGWAAKRIIDR